MQHTRSPSPVKASMAQLDGFPFDQPSSIPSTPKSTSYGSMSSPVTTPGLRGIGSVFGVTSEDIAHHLDEQTSFATKRETLVTALDSTTTLVKSLAAFNQEKWTIHYPHQLGLNIASSSSSGAQRDPAMTPTRSSSARASSLRRSASMHGTDDSAADDDRASSDEAFKRPLPQRAWSTAETPAKASTAASIAAAVPVAPAHPLSILSLDLKLGHPSAPTASLPALLPSLSVATLSQLLSRRLTSSLTHISSLRARVVDTNSRILVTGDLNAGKSTLVNALLRRDLMPSDQQPCTTVFCEVLDASSFNDGVEGLHAIRDIDDYDPTKPETFDLFSLAEVQEVQDSEQPYQILKAYVHDSRAPMVETEPNPSFIKNGLVSISLIDAPGLNRDTLSTTALFARQSEIDVIVFVVSAENHFTLSAKEFLWNASREKAYVFIVVNKWGAIKDKTRCMRLVGQQIKQLSPATWEARHELVHFVDAADVVDADQAAPPEIVVEDTKEQAEEVPEKEPTSFDLLEQSLRSFVLLKRTTSKLAPAKHYLLNLLADLSTLAEANVTAASDQLAEALRQLERVRPIHERLSAQRDEVEAGVDRVEETVVEVVRSSAWSRLERALGYVSEGQVVPPQDGDAERRTFEAVENLVAPTNLPDYPGLAGLWEWANEVKKTLVKALEAEVRAAEDEARIETSGGVEQVMHGLGEKYLPSTKSEQEREKETSSSPKDGQDPIGGQQTVAAISKKQDRVFRPEVMFAKRRRGVGRLAARGVSTGLGLGTGAAGLSSTPTWSATDFEVSVFDLFDLERLYSHGNRLRGKKAHDDDFVETSTILGLGVGTIGMLGSRVIGVKGTLDSITRIFEVLGSEKARKWAGPVLGVVTIGFAAYIIIDLPRAIPRNIGRKLQTSLSSSDALTVLSSSGTATQPPVTFASAHSERIARETRKVLRLAGWDLRERFRAALDQSAAERREVEATVAKAEGALKWLAEFEDKVTEEDDRVEAVVI